MKKNMRLTVVSIVALFLAINVLYVPVYAETKAVNAKKHDGMGNEYIEKALNLTPQQQQKLQDNRIAQRERMSQLINQMKAKHQILRQELKKPSVTKASVAPIVAEINSLQAQLINLRIDGILAVKEILSPEQFVKFQQMTASRPDGMRERFRNWR